MVQCPETTRCRCCCWSVAWSSVQRQGRAREAEPWGKWPVVHFCFPFVWGPVISWVGRPSFDSVTEELWCVSRGSYFPRCIVWHDPQARRRIPFSSFGNLVQKSCCESYVWFSSIRAPRVSSVDNDSEVWYLLFATDVSLPNSVLDVDKASLLFPIRRPQSYRCFAHFRSLPVLYSRSYSSVMKNKRWQHLRFRNTDELNIFLFISFFLDDNVWNKWKWKWSC